jgi:hypothetical protein
VNTLSFPKDPVAGTSQRTRRSLAQKEQIERQISRKSEELQQFKYRFFDVLEKMFSDNDPLLEKLHQIKIQSVDLFDILEEMVESAIITTLEKAEAISKRPSMRSSKRSPLKPSTPTSSMRSVSAVS